MASRAGKDRRENKGGQQVECALCVRKKKWGNCFLGLQRVKGVWAY